MFVKVKFDQITVFDCIEHHLFSLLGTKKKTTIMEDGVIVAIVFGVIFVILIVIALSLTFRKTNSVADEYDKKQKETKDPVGGVVF